MVNLGVRIAVLTSICAACGPLGAAVLYKSVDPNGTIQFSDLPPANAAGEVKKLQIPDGSSAPPMPILAQGPANEEKIREMDAAVQRASEQVDLAEHALALARRPMWSEPEPGKLTAVRMTLADAERIEFYKQSVKIARLTLCELLREKRSSAAREEMTASAGAPIYGPITLRR
jgi:uncharacterized protein DUF4124